jgi:hypothetical protein
MGAWRRVLGWVSRLVSSRTSAAEQPEVTISDVSDVFGLSRRLPLNYVRRDSVDGPFYRSLHHERNLVVYGSSKQGKTSLCRQSLPEASYIRVACQPGWSLATLHAQILKKAGYIVELSEARTLSNESKISVKLAGEIKTSGLGISGGEELTSSSLESVQKVESKLDLDPADVNDIITALENLGFDKYIILEDFHYLEVATQRSFAHALKAFYDESRIRFVIVGVWLDENRLFHFNRDLTGRVEAISADSWSQHQLQEVVAKGEALLKVQFGAPFVQKLVADCYSSVWIVQEACYRLCIEKEIQPGTAYAAPLGTEKDAARLIAEIIDSQSTQYLHFIRAFTQNAAAAARDVYRWLISAILVADAGKLKRGIGIAEIYNYIRETDPEVLISTSTLEFFFRNDLSWYQVQELKLNPIILDFDATRQCVTVTDRGFLIWIDSRDRRQLLDEAEVPTAVLAAQSARASRQSGRHGRPD